MMILWVIVLVFVYGIGAKAQADTTFVLESSVLTYHMSHPVHEVDGVSRGAKGRGVCGAETCDFLLAAPVKSFDSGDTNRDLHMLQVVRGAEFPVVVVKLKIPLADIAMKDFECELEVQFAGSTAHYSHVPFHQEINVPLRGDYTIRVGVHDRSANRVGTTEIPVASVMKLPPAINVGAAPPVPPPGE